jgi:hypothetical protein
MGQIITVDFGKNTPNPEVRHFGNTLDIETINQVIDAIAMPWITGDTIIKELKQVEVSFWYDGIAKIAHYIQNESDSEMSARRKSQVFWLMHFIMYEVAKPSAYILLSVHYAIESGDKVFLKETIDFIKREFNDVSMKKLLEEIGNDIVKEGWLYHADLVAIKTHLDLWWVQLPLF